MEGLLYFFVLSWQRLGNDLLQRPQEASYSTIKHTDLTERKLGLDERKENEGYGMWRPKIKDIILLPLRQAE